MESDTNPAIPEPTPPQPADTKKRNRTKVILKVAVVLLASALTRYAISSFLSTADEQNDGHRPTQTELAGALRQDPDFIKGSSVIDESVRPKVIDAMSTCMGDRLVKSDLPDTLLRKLVKGENATVNSSQAAEYQEKIEAMSEQCGKEVARKILTP